MDLPAEQRYDLKARSAVKRGMLTTQVCFVFGAAYPLLGGVFFQSGILVQALLIPVFFAFRALFEYSLDIITAKMFGSDGMPVYFGIIFNRFHAHTHTCTHTDDELWRRFDARTVSECDDHIH